MTTAKNKELLSSRDRNDHLTNRLYLFSGIIFILAAATGYFNFSILLLEFLFDRSLQQQTFQISFLIHLLSSMTLVILTTLYIWRHLANIKQSKNRRARNAGVVLLTLLLIIIATGFALVRGVYAIELPSGILRTCTYIGHTLIPFIAVYFLMKHRQSGKRRVIGRRYFKFATIGIFSILLFQYSYEFTVTEIQSTPVITFEQSNLKIKSNDAAPQPEVFTNNQYCKSCHQDIHDSWRLSAHHFSSFNNPFYESAVTRLQKNLMLRDNNVVAARFCAGCHDPLVLLNGGFDKEVVNNDTPFAQEGLTCTFCHSISSVDSSKGNTDITLENPRHYPFAQSQNTALRTLSNVLLESNPDFHIQTFSKPLLKSPAMCGSCHKVHIPQSLNNYKWLRGQNHFDSFRLSGVSGTNIDSFFYPETIKENCQSCHMAKFASEDPSADLNFDGVRQVMGHQFASGNSALAVLSPEHASQIIKMNEDLLKDSVTVDIVGLRENGELDGQFIMPGNDNTFAVTAGKTYIAEVVVRTRTLGHTFTNGTTDSNQVWLSVNLTDGTESVANSGNLDTTGTLPTENVHLIKSLTVDKDGNEIKFRNVEDLVAAVYNNQIPPGASSVVHYRFSIPSTPTGPLSLSATLNYRKFAKHYTHFSLGDAVSTELPVVTIHQTTANLALSPVEAESAQMPYNEAYKARLLDYGIGLYRKPERSEFKKAEKVLSSLFEQNDTQAGMNLLRLYYDEGRLTEALALIERLYALVPYNIWTVQWYESKIARDLGEIETSLEILEAIVSTRYYSEGQSLMKFNEDDKVLLALAETHFSMAQMHYTNESVYQEHLNQSATFFNATLANDAENAQAHYGLWKVYKLQGKETLALSHKSLHLQYKTDEESFNSAVTNARLKNPEWDKEASLHRIYELTK